MTEFAFEVESVLEITHRGAIVFARALDAKPFENLEKATLNGCPIEPWTDIPRIQDSKGQQRLDLFAFQLRERSDLTHFVPGQRVVLATS